MVEIYHAPKRESSLPPLKKAKVVSKAKPVSSADSQYRQEVYKMIGHTVNPLAAFVARPKKLSFETQFDGEEIILLLRRHWITNLGWILLTVIMAIAPVTLVTFPLLSFLPARFQFVSILMWYLITIAFAFEKFLTWYFNVYIITDERIVDVDFYNLVYKEVSDAELEKVEDVTMTMGGVIQTIFNYGDVFVQTAAEKREFEFELVPNPTLIVQVLQRLRMEEKQEAIEGRIR